MANPEKKHGIAWAINININHISYIIYIYIHYTSRYFMYSNSPVAKLDDPGSRAVYCKLAGHPKAGQVLDSKSPRSMFCHGLGA